MGPHGCNRVQGCGREGKQGKHAHIVLYRAWFLALWPGNFPQKPYTCGAGIKGNVWVHMDNYVCGWVQWDTCARGERKTRQKDEQMREQDIFWNAWPRRKNTVSWQGWLWWSQMIIWGEWWQKMGSWHFLILISKAKYTNICNSAKKRAKPANLSWFKLRTKQAKKSKNQAEQKKYEKLSPTPQNELSLLE